MSQNLGSLPPCHTMSRFVDPLPLTCDVIYWWPLILSKFQLEIMYCHMILIIDYFFVRRLRIKKRSSRLAQSVATSLSFDQDIPGWIPGSAVGFFSSGELFHGMYGLDASVYRCNSSSVVFQVGPCILLITDQGKPPNCLSAPVCGPCKIKDPWHSCKWYKGRLQKIKIKDRNIQTFFVATRLKTLLMMTSARSDHVIIYERRWRWQINLIVYIEFHVSKPCPQ